MGQIDPVHTHTLLPPPHPSSLMDPYSASVRSSSNPKPPNPPSHWTVRSPYRTVIKEHDDGTLGTTVPGQSSSSSGGDMLSNSNSDSPSQPKSLRTTRPTPAYLPNFIHPGPQAASNAPDERERFYNNRNLTYSWPCDERENSRQDRQHVAFYILLRGLYPCPELVRPALRQTHGVPRTILDLGCGTGTWAIEMAKEFPHATVLGVDLVPCPANPSDVPPNCRFEIDDINDGLDHFTGAFDLVHVRNIAWGLKNYRKTMEEVSKCLKPGGVAIFVDFDLEFLCYDMVTVLPMAMVDKEVREMGSMEGRSSPGEDAGAKASGIEGSWLQRICYELRYANELGGSDLTGAADAIDEGLWRMSTFESESCGASSVFLPVGKWVRTADLNSTSQLDYAGSLMRLSILSGLNASRNIFLRYGISQSIFDQWMSSASYELASQKYRSYLRLRVAWGRRREIQGAPGSIPPSISPAALAAAAAAAAQAQAEPTATQQEWEDPGTRGLRPVEVYKSQAEALRAKEARMLTRTVQPVPLIAQLAKGGGISI